MIGFRVVWRLLGREPLPPKSGLTIVAVDAEATAQLMPLLREIHGTHPRLEVMLLGAQGDAWMHSRPIPPASLSQAFLKATSNGMVLFAGAPGAELEPLRRAAFRRGCTLALVAPLPSPAQEKMVQLKRRYQLDHLFTYGGRDTPAPIEGWTDLDQCDHDEFLRVLKKFAARQNRNVALRRRPAGLFDGIGAAIAERKFRRIGSIEHLRSLLDSPATVMCLGNGPSSETPELAGLAYDRLFRVNHSWQARGKLIAPDLVFTHLIKAIWRVRPRIGFVVRHAIDERYMRWHLRWWPRVIRLGTAERLGIDPPKGFESLHQTHGAMMLAAAVALKPARLIVAGIDLFADAAGAYPGDTQTVNAYALGHDRDSERRYIVSLLRAYNGELIVFGDALQHALAETQAVPDAPPQTEASHRAVRTA